MQVILAGNLVTHIYMGLNEVLRASGYPQKAMAATLTAVIVNCGLDALFIMGIWLGYPGGIGKLLRHRLSLWDLSYTTFPVKSFFAFPERNIRLKRQIVGNAGNRVISVLMNLCACFVVILINKSLKTYGGDLAIGAYGIVNRIVFLFIMIVMGFNQGMQPIAGYNFGGPTVRSFDSGIGNTPSFCGVAVTTVGFWPDRSFPDR